MPDKEELEQILIRREDKEKENKKENGDVS